MNAKNTPDEVDEIPASALLPDRELLLRRFDGNDLVLVPWVATGLSVNAGGIGAFMGSLESATFESFWLPIANGRGDAMWGVYVGNQRVAQVSLESDDVLNRMLLNDYVARGWFPCGYIDVYLDSPEVLEHLFDGSSSWPVYENTVTIEGKDYLVNIELWLRSQLGFSSVEDPETELDADQIVAFHSDLVAFNSVISDPFVEGRVAVDSRVRDLADLVRSILPTVEYCLFEDSGECPPGRWSDLHKSLWTLISEMEGLLISQQAQSLTAIRGSYEALIFQLDHL